MNAATPIICCCAAACYALTAAAQGEDSYTDTAQGWAPYTMADHEIPGSLRRALRPEQQHSRRYPGVPTPEELRIQNRPDTDSNTLFPAHPPKMMSYLDSLFIPGNSCAEPCAVIGEDAISTAAQRLKTALSEIGLQYSMTFSYNYVRVAPSSRGRQAHYSSFNNDMVAKWFLLKNQKNRHALFLSCEADWGQGCDFNENRSSAQKAIGSLSAPQGCLRGGSGVFLPELALGASLYEGRYVFMVGTIDASNYLDQNAYSASWSGNLINRSFNYNPGLPLLWSNWGVLTAWQPCERFYTLSCLTGSNAPINHNSLRYISRHEWVNNCEMGYISKDLFGCGAGTYRLQHTVTRSGGDSGNGVAVNLQQQFGRSSQLGFFTRCGYNDSDATEVTGCRATATGGLVLQAPFRDSGWGSRANNDQIALGLLWQRAPIGESERRYRSEYGIELTAVAQLTPTLFLQPDVQYIYHPAYSTGRSGAWVLQLQSVWRF